MLYIGTYHILTLDITLFQAKNKILFDWRYLTYPIFDAYLNFFFLNVDIFIKAEKWALHQRI